MSEPGRRGREAGEGREASREAKKHEQKNKKSPAEPADAAGKDLTPMLGTKRKLWHYMLQFLGAKHSPADETPELPGPSAGILRRVNRAWQAAVVHHHWPGP